MGGVSSPLQQTFITLSEKAWTKYTHEIANIILNFSSNSVSALENFQVICNCTWLYLFIRDIYHMKM